MNVHKQNAVRKRRGMEVKLNAGKQNWEGMEFPTDVKAEKKNCTWSTQSESLKQLIFNICLLQHTFCHGYGVPDDGYRSYVRSGH